MRTALYFGSFNPPHCGHAAIARYLYEHAHFQEVRIVLSPQNPLKDKRVLLEDSARMAMVRAWTDAQAYLNLCTLEFEMERPSYTYLTLRRLRQQEPHTDFVIVMGADSFVHFPCWREFEEIARNHEICVYPRQGFHAENARTDFLRMFPYAKVSLLNAPVFPFSSTEIREMLSEGKDISEKVPAEVLEYIQKNRVYR